MIPNFGCDPNINIVKIGAFILTLLKQGEVSLMILLKKTAQELAVSIDHVILSLDWLFMISAISIQEDYIYINETK